MNKIYKVALLILLFPLATFAQLSNTDKVTLTFTPNSGSVVTATATDSGSGLVADGPINLLESTEYALSIVLNDGDTDITGEVVNNAANLQFFFNPSDDLFEGEVTYSDADINNLPVGLGTSWTGSCVDDSDLSGTFQVVLKDLSGTKSANSTINDGTSVLDVSWTINITNDADAPECENEEEVIDRVTLTFTPKAGGDPVVAVASDPDGPGPMDLVVGDISLMESTEYTLSIMLENTIEGEDITAEILAEDDEHLFLFAFGEDVFESPDGDGNIDNRADAINYNDQDDNGLPVGLSTDWTTACTGEGDVMDMFRVVLKHQPGIKSAMTGFDDGGTDIDISWDITIVDDPNAPECENEEEVIDRITLTFTPKAGGDPVVAVASDPDGPGPMDLVVQPISLMESTEYTLSIMLENTIEGEDITAEIMEEDDEHQFFFGFGEDVFESPDGDGNIDNSGDPINYNDQDDNGLPVGLSTDWTTACTGEGDVMDMFRLILKHQPDIKSAMTGVDDGGTDLDISWDITIVDDPNAPECENEEEVIDRITLTFTPKAGGDPVVAVASDPDGPGPMDLVVQPISLMESTEYTLSIMLENTIEGEDITAEIMEEDDEHQFFFGFGEDVFESPDGDGNIDNSGDPINYNDQDDNGLPVGLSTDWTTACTGEGDVMDIFRLILKHQPDIKSAMTGVDDGGTDLDISWDITIVDDPNAPECENEEEVIDRITLTFTPKAGGDPVVAVASDPDGPGPMDLVVQPISLMESTEYTLSIMLENTIEGEDITAEIMEEDDEHQFFFGFGEDVFESPDGDGNIDNSGDPINYNDQDDNGLPVGLSTDWTTACTGEGDVMDMFRLILKHQPDIKSAMTGVNDGGTDLDISWDITIVDDPNAPECENEEEVIDRVTLTFTPVDGGDAIVAVATDPDGPGPMDLMVEDISLVQNTVYEMAITLENTEEGEDITEEIREEDDEHQFFFAWTGDIFSDPTGDGNIDNAADPVNYNDQDDNGLPIGLSTNWTTNVAMSGGTLRIVLKHQPDIKSATSTAEDGGTDLDITWNINSVVTSITELRDDQRIEIAPNPVYDDLRLMVENVDLSDVDILIYNTFGSVVKRIQNPGNTINVSELPNGNYFMNIQGRDLFVSRRFIKIN